MSSLIRSTRIASELKILSATRTFEACKIVGIPQLQSHGAAPPAPARTDTTDHQGPSADAVALAVASKPAPVAVPTPADYPEYEKRFSRELTALRSQTLAAARDEGLQQGRQAGHQEYAERLSRLQSLITAAQAAQVRGIETVADDAAEVVLTAIAKVLGDGFLSRDAAVAAVREAVRRCQGRDKLHIRVAPEQLAMLEERRGELLDGTVTSHVTLVADEQVRGGGCVIESAAGTLDARLETQLHRLVDALRAARTEWEVERA